MVKFDSGTLIDRAIKKAGHADFGGDSWREGLDRLVDAQATHRLHGDVYRPKHAGPLLDPP